MADKTRREILEEAFDAEEQSDTTTAQGADSGTERDTRASAEGGEDTSGTSGEEQGQDAAGDDRRADEGKERISAQKDTKKKTTESTQQQPDGADKKEKEAAEAAQRGDQSRSVSDRPPNSWKPGAREEWAKIPARARAEIARRETEIQRELSQTATIRRFSQDLAAIVQPHLPAIQAQGIAPLQHIDGLLRRASALQAGSQEQKAQQISEIMKMFNVDVRVLDKVLAGQPIPPNLVGGAPNGGGNSNTIPPWAKPLFDNLNSQEMQRRQYQEALNASAAQEVEQGIQKFEFLQDLRQDVADILEIAARRGRVMTLEEAYNRAVAADPEVSQIVAQKTTAARQQAQGSNLARQRRAASTVRGTTPRGTGGGNTKLTRRQQLEEAWNDAT